MTTTPKPTLDERRDELALKQFNMSAGSTYETRAFCKGWDACRAEMQAEHKEHMREQFADLVKRQRELQEENQRLRSALEKFSNIPECPHPEVEEGLQVLKKFARKALEGK